MPALLSAHERSAQPAVRPRPAARGLAVFDDFESPAFSAFAHAIEECTPGFAGSAPDSVLQARMRFRLEAQPSASGRSRVSGVSVTYEDVTGASGALPWMSGCVAAGLADVPLVVDPNAREPMVLDLDFDVEGTPESRLADARDALHDPEALDASGLSYGELEAWVASAEEALATAGVTDFEDASRPEP